MGVQMRKAVIRLFCLHLLLICHAPAFHGLDDRAHGFAEFRQRILHAGWHLRVDGTANDSVSLHGAQSLRQRLLADAVDALLQLVEAPGAGKEIAHNEKLPLAADHHHRRGYRAFG